MAPFHRLQNASHIAHLLLSIMAEIPVENSPKNTAGNEG